MVTVFEKILDYFMVLCLLFGSLITNGAENNDLNTIGNNIVYGLVSGNFSPFASSDIYDGETIISKIETDNDGNCRFADVDYKDKDRASWLTARHITRTEQLAILYRRETDENIKIICNTDSIQAIELPDGRIASVFYKNGSFEYNGKTFSGKAGNAYISEK